MSMDYVLEATAAYLRSKNGWEVSQCDINVSPPPAAGQFYVCIDDGGVDQLARAEDYWLKEAFVVEVAIWRRPGQLPKDRLKELLKNTSRLMAEMKTINPLERAVVKTLHKSQGWRGYANTLAGLPIGGKGDLFRVPLIYQGRSKNEFFTDPDGNEFFGRRLRFRGADRTQSIEDMQ